MEDSKEKETKKDQLELELIKLSSLDKDRDSYLKNIKKLQTDILNNRIHDIDYRHILQENTEVFSTQENKIKLRNFLADYPVIRIDLSYLSTSTYCLQVAFDQKKEFSEQYQQILPFLPYLINIPNVIECPLKISGRHIKIKEYTFGESGLIELIAPDHVNEVWICRTNQRVTSIIKKYSKWEDAFKYVYETYPFFTK